MKKMSLRFSSLDNWVVTVASDGRFRYLYQEFVSKYVMDQLSSYRDLDTSRSDRLFLIVFNKQYINSLFKDDEYEPGSF